ncbi:hypothetical protein [Streptomyces sp. NPDC049881]|uniref:hypothetical protein n=1 Tax=Streptomyces sp. NPDC049881 TaxID=3155778 RepID=UPI0034404452
MGRHEGDDELPDVRNEISGGDIDGPVGQFGTVHGDVNMHWARPHDPAELARAMEAAILRAEQARRAEAARQERLRREEKERAERFRLITGLVCAAVLFGVFFFLFDFWWWVAAFLALGIGGEGLRVDGVTAPARGHVWAAA